MATNGTSIFQQAIENTPDVAACFCNGIKAVKASDRSKITLSRPTLLDGSLDIDSNVATLYPDANRWDYVISYNNVLTYLEIHPAYDKEIKRMAVKLAWLKSWLRMNAPLIAELPKSDKPYCWIPSGETRFLSASASRKKIAQLGISFENKLKLE